MPRSTGNCCQNVAGLCRVALSNSLIALQLMATSRDKKAEAKAKAQAKPKVIGECLSPLTSLSVLGYLLIAS